MRRLSCLLSSLVCFEDGTELFRIPKSLSKPLVIAELACPPTHIEALASLLVWMWSGASKIKEQALTLVWSQISVANLLACILLHVEVHADGIPVPCGAVRQPSFVVRAVTP